MADKLRRARDQVKKSLSSYLKATTESYTKYLEGSPTYITYYQLDSLASKQDVGLESVNNLVGANTPNKYKRIYELPVYGIDALEISNELSERGLESSVGGEFIVLPNTIRPYPGDFICFESYDGLEEHLFRVNDVQFDRATVNKYFRVTFSLWHDNVDIIFDNVIDDYNIEYNENGGVGSGTEEIKVVPASESQISDSTKSLVDAMIEKYEKMFYDEESDSFICRDMDGYAYWSPYLQHFLYNTKALSRYNGEIMTEIYIADIEQYDNPMIYSEAVYRNSLFRAIEVKNKDLTFDMNFLSVPEFNLKMRRNLPFFMSNLKFKLINPVVKKDVTDLNAYMNAFPFLFPNTPLFKDVDHEHKVHIMDEIHLARLEPYLKDRDIIYETRDVELVPTKLCVALEKIENGERIIEIQDASIERFIHKEEQLDIPELELFKIIRDYLNGEFEITEKLLDKLDKYFFKPTIVHYILMPIILYILKSKLS